MAEPQWRSQSVVRKWPVSRRARPLREGVPAVEIQPRKNQKISTCQLEPVCHPCSLASPNARYASRRKRTYFPDLLITSNQQVWEPNSQCAGWVKGGF